MPSIASDAAAPNHDRPRERLLADGPRALSDADLVALLLGAGSSRLSARSAALALVETVPLAELAWAPPDAIASAPGIGLARAATIAAAFELGRRAGWSPPQRGERCLDPRRVSELMRHAAHAERETFAPRRARPRGRRIGPAARPHSAPRGEARP